MGVDNRGAEQKDGQRRPEDYIGRPYDEKYLEALIGRRELIR